MHTQRDRIRGCLLAGALGDALGAPIEFESADLIARRFPDGIATLVPSSYGSELGLFTDDTQMTLFTVEALTTNASIIELHRAYLRWYATQLTVTPPDGADTPLAQTAWLYARRGPGNTCLSALDATNRLGEFAQNNSKGCGGVMRSAPFGFLSLEHESRYDLACSAAGLTHGHPTGQVASGALALIIAAINDGGSLPDAVAFTITYLGAHDRNEETLKALQRAVELSAEPPSRTSVETLGEGWIAEEALAIAVYAALEFANSDELISALSLAVMHGGDSDSTGAICGNILGALHGPECIPATLRGLIEGEALIVQLADAFAKAVASPLDL